jgi:prepilin-type N-terminal cleavage/methylation domain-containing protein
MKKLNNKGFTLVELLAVVVILVIIMLVSIPNISSSIERRNKKNEAKMKEVIIDASELFVTNKEESISSNLKNCSTKKCIISVSELIDAGYLVKNEVKDYMDYCLIYDGDTKTIDSNNFNVDICNNSKYINCSNSCPQ